MFHLLYTLLVSFVYIQKFYSRYYSVDIMVIHIAEEKAKLKKLQLEEKKKNAEFRTKVRAPQILVKI